MIQTSWIRSSSKSLSNAPFTLQKLKHLYLNSKPHWIHRSPLHATSPLNLNDVDKADLEKYMVVLTCLVLNQHDIVLQSNENSVYGIDTGEVKVNAWKLDIEAYRNGLKEDLGLLDSTLYEQVIETYLDFILMAL